MNLTYHGEKVKVAYGHYKTAFLDAKVDGYAWCVFDGAEDYLTDKKGYPTEEEAWAAAGKQIEKWNAQDAQSEKEGQEYAKFMQRTYDSKEAAVKNGCDNPIEYVCDECGGGFWAQRRSKYTPVPYCPYCNTEDRMMIHEAGDAYHIERNLRKFGMTLQNIKIDNPDNSKNE